MTTRLSHRIVILITIILVAAGSSFLRNSIWHEEVTLWHDAVAKSPGKAGAYYSLGSAYAKIGRIDQAMKYMRRSIELDNGVQFKAWIEDRSSVLSKPDQ